MKYLRLAFTVLLAGFAATSAKAFWVYDQYAFGSGGYKGNNLGFFVAAATNTVAGTDIMIYKTDALGSSSYSASFPVYIYNYGKVTTIKPFFYPSTNRLSTSAYGLSLQHLFTVYADSVNNTWSQVSLGTAYASQRADMVFPDGNRTMHNMRQLAYNAQFIHNYYGEFTFTTSAGFFQYLDGGAGDIAVLNPVLNQSILVDQGTQAAVTGFPLYTLGIDIARTDISEHYNGGTMLLTYRYCTYKTDDPATHTLALTLKANFTDNGSFDFGYDWIAAGGGRGKTNFYHAGLKYVF